MGRQIADFPLSKLKEYKPKHMYKPSKFQVFWDDQKKKINGLKPNVAITWEDYVIPTMEVANLLFESWDGTPLKGGLDLKESGSVQSC